MWLPAYFQVVHQPSAEVKSPVFLRKVWTCLMERSGVNVPSLHRMDSVAKALEEVLTSALPQGCITVGVYEAAKSLNVDPDNVVLCILATDDEDVKDVALQIHFTLIQAFCCENDINILRVNNTRRLAEILGGGGGGGGGGKQSGGEPLDLHCVLVTSPHSTSWKDPALTKVNRFCRESRCMDQWVPIINLPER
ncbi:growth arrest and DNA-damage-inducible, alpha, a isoform X1 [Acanthopagrus latus]|uniref:growth arrest and DNA-damage-inducible, alpha, a isoform X1 n=2 Tax=Acanthopagrus latus TaxID=8177 RepID=UPI00187C27D7|nr:growth arrest and DNA-damage-inducible, alpha, a isoform X1 [Acanthopagrus latus]